MKKTFIGIIISLVFVLILLRDLNLETVCDSFNSVHWHYIVLYFIAQFLLYVLRSFRWGLLLRPLLRIKQKILFPITAVGFMALLILPARTGEVARPYLLSKRTPIAISTALATIVVERIMDVLSILLLLFIASFSSTLPLWVSRAGSISMAVMVGIILFLFLLVKREQAFSQILQTILKFFPDRINELIQNCICSFSQGASILLHWQIMAGVFLTSVCIWFGVALLNYIMFLSFEFPLSWTAAYVLVVIVDLGLMIPAAPGFVGSYQFFCVVGLSIFGVRREEALSYSILSHALQIIFVFGLGLIFLPQVKVSGISLSNKTELS